jgi:hypothetical protein
MTIVRRALLVWAAAAAMVAAVSPASAQAPDGEALAVAFRQYCLAPGPAAQAIASAAESAGLQVVEPSALDERWTSPTYTQGLTGVRAWTLPLAGGQASLLIHTLSPPRQASRINCLIAWRQPGGGKADVQADAIGTVLGVSGTRGAHT